MSALRRISGWTDERGLASTLYYGAASSTGDGIIMATAEGIDAATCLMEYGKRYPNGVEEAKALPSPPSRATSSAGR